MKMKAYRVTVRMDRSFGDSTNHEYYVGARNVPDALVEVYEHIQYTHLISRLTIEEREVTLLRKPTEVYEVE